MESTRSTMMFFIRAGGTIQHRAKGQRRQLVQQPDAGIGQHMERRMVGKRGGHAVQQIAQHPEARHPRAERQAVHQLRRAVYQCGDEPDDDEIRNKRAGDAQQRREDTQSVLAVPPFCQLCQPRGGGSDGSISFMMNSFRLHYAARCFFTIRLPIIAPIKAATITPATSATDTQDCSIWDAARMAS